jgi:hypothetical protein
MKLKVLRIGDYFVVRCNVLKASESIEVRNLGGFT